MAEVELSILARQCLGRRRLGNLETMKREVEAWGQERKRTPVKVTWQFTTADARIKLRNLYPSIQRG